MQHRFAPRFSAVLAGAALVAGSLLGLGQVAVVGAEAAFPPGPYATDFPPGPTADIVIVSQSADFPPGPSLDGVIVNDARPRVPAKKQVDGIIVHEGVIVHDAPAAYPPGPSLDGIIIPG